MQEMPECRIQSQASKILALYILIRSDDKIVVAKVECVYKVYL